MFLSIGPVVIDDIVLPDGHTRMGMLGGGATHSAMGMRVWSGHVALLAPLGCDVPEADRGRLARAFDLRSLARRDAPSPRAWQLYEHDGRRTHVDRTDADLFMAMCPRPDELPAEYAGASGARLECDAPDPLREWMARLRAAGCGHILWEPWNVFCRPENRELFGQLAPLLDVVSPNLLQAQRLTGLKDPRQVLAALLEAGVRVAVLRMGRGRESGGRSGRGRGGRARSARLQHRGRDGRRERVLWRLSGRAGRDGRPGARGPLRRSVGLVRARAVRRDVHAQGPEGQGRTAPVFADGTADLVGKNAMLATRSTLVALTEWADKVLGATLGVLGPG